MRRLHDVLRRQLERHLAGVELPREWESFIASVDEAYRKFDADKRKLQRSLASSSAELQQLNSKQDSVFQASPDQFVWLDHHARIVDSRSRDDQFPCFLARPDNGVLLTDVVPPEIGPAFDHAIRRVGELGVSATLEYYVRGEGAERCYEARLMPLSANPLTVVIRDISEQDRIRKKLRAGEERYRSLFHSSPVPMWVFDVSTLRFLAVNEAAVHCYGYSRAEFSTMKVTDVLIDGDARAVLDQCARAGSSSGGFLARHRTRNGTVLEMEMRSHELVFSGTPAWIVLSNDVTEQRRVGQLRLAMEAAEQASQAKSAFMAVMSHELRTPLNAIIGYSEMVLESCRGDAEDRFREDLGRIHAAGKQLLVLINDILDLSKIEAGKMELTPESFAVRELADGVWHTVSPLARGGGNELGLVCPDDAGVMHTDRVKLNQVLLNLLGNACKFTQNGLIALEIARDQAEDRAWCIFRVRTTGVGLSPSEQTTLFNEFMQVDSPTTRKHGGIALGWAISRRLCRMLGGAIELHSDEDHGSTFTVRVPAKLPESGDRSNECDAAAAIAAPAETS